MSAAGRPPVWLRAAPLVVLVVVLALVPQLLNPFWTTRVTTWLVWAIAAMGLNLLVGFNGQISIGHGALFGLGAYACGIWVDRANGQFLMGVIVAAVVAFVAGVVIGLPALRVRGLALALLTIAVAAIFPDLVLRFSSLTGGTNGLQIQVPTPYRGEIVDRAAKWTAPEWTGLAPDQWRFYVYSVAMVLCLLAVAALVRSRTGRALVAIRDNEVAAEVNGINVDRMKVITFGLSGALAGIGGAMFALIDLTLTPDAFRLLLSLNLLVMIVLGGLGTVAGPVVGALTIGFFEDVIRKEVLPTDLGLVTPIVLGVLLILSMQFAPGGTVGSIHHLGEALRHRRERRAPAT